MTDMPRPMKKHWERTLGGESSSNHTPGPWTAEWTRSPEPATYWRVWAQVKGDPAIQVADEVWDEADAQLISAAPELLQALLEALQRYEGFPQTAIPKWVYKARKAIKKAGATPLPQPRREMD